MEKIRPCIDLVDSLRALGIEKDLSLPAIAVIGDQSSGKSSVLEALSGVALPRGNGKNSLSQVFTLMRWKGFFFSSFSFFGLELDNSMTESYQCSEAPQGKSKAHVPGSQETRGKKCGVVAPPDSDFPENSSAAEY